MRKGADPGHGYGPPPGRGIQLGEAGVVLAQAGLRPYAGTLRRPKIALPTLTRPLWMRSRVVVSEGDAWPRMAWLARTVRCAARRWTPLGAVGRADQDAEPGRIDEANLVQVGHERPAAGRQLEQLFPQPGHGDHVNLPDDGHDGVVPARPFDPQTYRAVCGPTGVEPRVDDAVVDEHDVAGAQDVGSFVVNVRGRTENDARPFVAVTFAFPLVASSRCGHLLCCSISSLIFCPRAPSGLTR